jgi:MYXO-CTERM domain-containing protein
MCPYGTAREAREEIMAKGSSQKILVAVALACVLSVATRTNAGVIPLGNSGWEAIFDASLDPFVDIVVDGETSEAVFLQKFAEFTNPPGPGGIFSGINIVFRQTRPGAVQFIVINDEVITNSTGTTWFDFHMELVDSGDAVFDPVRTGNSGGPPPVGFSVAPFTNASFNNGNTTLDIDGGPGIPNGGIWFPGNGPSDGQLWIQANPRPSAPFTVFTLKERPSIPEPSALAFLAVGGLALIRRRK